MKKKLDPYEFLQQRYEATRKLVAKYGIEGVRQALEQCELTPEEEKKGGRPKDFDSQSLMDLWLFVEEGAARKNLSIHAFCGKAEFKWHAVGGPKGATVVRSVKGATLHKRYYEAQSFLEKQSEAYRKKGVRIKLGGKEIDYMSPVERYWRTELERRLAAKS